MKKYLIIYLLMSIINYCAHYNTKYLNSDKDYERLGLSAEQGNAVAQYNLGNSYYQGQDTEQDYKKAVKWLTKAALQDHAMAQNNLGCCYQDGLGVKQSHEKAVEWFTKAAEQGCAAAQFNLAYC